MLSCEICKTFKNTYFEEHLLTAGSVEDRTVMFSFKLLLLSIELEQYTKAADFNYLSRNNQSVNGRVFHANFPMEEFILKLMNHNICNVG